MEDGGNQCKKGALGSTSIDGEELLKATGKTKSERPEEHERLVCWQLVHQSHGAHAHEVKEGRAGLLEEAVTLWHRCPEQQHVTGTGKVTSIENTFYAEEKGKRPSEGSRGGVEIPRQGAGEII